MNSMKGDASEVSKDDEDLKRWEGYKKAYDILAGNAKERWQCGYNTLQMFLRGFNGVDVPLYILQLYLRKKARAFKEREQGAIANLTPEEMLRFGEFTQLEDMAAYVFDIAPFSEKFNECLYYPHLMSASVGGTERLTVGQLFQNEGGRYVNNTQQCKDARATHLACVIESTKYEQYEVNGKKYTGGQLFAKSFEDGSYILKGEEFDKIRSIIAVESCSDVTVKIGGIMTTVSNLFGYEYDKKIYEEDRRNYARIFLKKIESYFKYAGTRAGIPVVFNAMIYLIVGTTMEPEPSVYLLDPHDFTFMGPAFKDKKKRVPLQYILGSPTGATLFFPPVDDEETKQRIKEELLSEQLYEEGRRRFIHLIELALFNKEAYLKELVKKSVGDPPPGLEEFFRLLENYGRVVFETALVEELARVFNTSTRDLTPILEFVMKEDFSVELLADELAHHFVERTLEQHESILKELFQSKTRFVALPAFLKNFMENGVPSKEEYMWNAIKNIGKLINVNRIKSSMLPASITPLTEEELMNYTYIFRGLLFLFGSQDRYSHVENVQDFLGTEEDIDLYYIAGALASGLKKGSGLRNAAWLEIVERVLHDLAEKLHKILHGTVLLDMSIDRFLKKMEKGQLKVKEDLLNDIAAAYNEACNKLFLPLDGVLWMVDQLRNRMKRTNIIKRQVLVAISGNINSHPDLKEKVAENIKLDIPEVNFDYHQTREIILEHAKKIHDILESGIGFKQKLVYQLADISLFKDPARADEWLKVVDVLDSLRQTFKANMDKLQAIIENNVGTLEDIGAIQNVMQFNDLFRLEGAKETDFAAKINAIYNKKYEVLDLEEVEENISPLTIRIY